MKGLVYKVTNSINDKIYIGITTKTIEERQKDHLKKSRKGKSYAFQDAIASYGIDVFKWEQLDTLPNINELAQKEKEYILKYDSKEKGYNLDQGGGVQKTVYQYDFNGNLLNTYKKLESAGSAVNAVNKMMSKVCLSVNKFYKNSYWTYNLVEKFIPQQDKRRKVVHQYTLNGEFINKFSSVSEASKQTGCNKTSIAKVCRGERKSCGGYFWKYY